MGEGVKRSSFSCGVLEAVRVARAGYPVRLPHAEFARRYRCAAPAGWVYKPPKIKKLWT